MSSTSDAHSATPNPGGEERTGQSGSGTVSKTPSEPVKQANSVDALIEELEDAISEPESVVGKGYAPAPFFLAFEPSESFTDQREVFDALLGTSAVARMFAAINIITARKTREPATAYSLKNPNEFVDAFNESTDATVDAFTKGALAALFSPSSSLTQTEDKKLKRSEIHDFVLSRVFNSLSQIGPESIESLDEILTQFVALLKPFPLCIRAEQPTLKHVILINYIQVTDITGGGEAFVIDPYTRMVILTLKPEQWSQALHKPGFLKRNEKIDFSMTTTTVDLKLDEAKYKANESRYEHVLQTTVEDNPELRKVMEGGLVAFGRATCTVWPAQET